MTAELSLIAKATLILGVALLATRVAHRARASVRSLILTAALGLVLVLPIASAIAPAREVTIPQSYASRFLIEEEIVERVADPGVPQTQTPGPSSPRWSMPSTRALAGSVWLTGAIVTLLPLALGLWRLREIRRRARVWAEGAELADALRHSVHLQRPVAVVVHDALIAPMTCGWAQPLIAMPADASHWPVADVRHALLHELEHVRRYDWPVHVLARLTCSLYWFHPAAWIAWRQLSLESERACDDAVVLHAENTAYAEQLVTLARRLTKGSAVPLLSMADHRTLSTRVAAILSTTAARGRVGARAAALVLMAAAALAAVIAPVKAVGVQARGAQAANGPAFEVASIRRNNSSQPGQTITQRGNTFVAQNVTARELVMTAFGVQAEQVSGGPGWIDSERYDVTGRPSAEASWDQQLLMVQRLLADRFKLSIRREMREAPAYALVIGRSGPKLKVANACTDSAAGSKCGGFSTRPGRFTGRSVSVAQVAMLLSGRSGRPVVNKTSIEGLYDVELTWTPDPSQLPKGRAPDGVPPFDPSGPSLFTALQEQLGLKLEPATAPKEHLIIEGIERPTANDAPELQADAPRANQILQPSAQSLQFAVASIRPSPAGTTRDLGGCCTVRYSPGGRVTATNVGVIDLIVSAYRLQYWQISGGPSWANPDMMVTTDRYNVEAAAAGDATPEQLREMLRALLADRFRLVLRPDTQTRRTYDLVAASGGPKLQQVKADEYRESVRAGGGRIIAEQMTMADLARMLGGQVQTVVNDRTGLQGIYKFSVAWTPDQFRLSGVGRPAANGEPGIDANGPTLFDAVRDQLGLRLQETKGPIPSAVIERVERPTPNDAQNHAPAFEVASVKANVSNSTSSSSDDTPGGYTAINIPLRRLIAFAYRIQPPLDRDQIVGPSWIEGARFDIVARAPAGTLRSQIPDMLRALLIERFKLVARPEIREASVYALLRARSDGQRGPQLTPSSLDCSQPGSGFSGSVGTNSLGAAVASEKPQCGIISVVDSSGAILRGGGRSMAELARNLTGRVNRPVVDRTGLGGIHDFILRWTPENFQNVAADAGPSRDGTSIFTALQEQLGLKLESQRAPIAFLIIDKVERPTAN